MVVVSEGVVVEGGSFAGGALLLAKVVMFEGLRRFGIIIGFL